jgi:hypothetical protein
MLRLALIASWSVLSVGSLVAQGWVDRSPANPLTGPSPRWDAPMCWDATHGYALVAGGAYVTDTWSWDGVAWTRRFPTTPVPQIQRPKGFAMTFHPPTGEVVLVAQTRPSRGTVSTGWCTPTPHCLDCRATRTAWPQAMIRVASRRSCSPATTPTGS